MNNRKNWPTIIREGKATMVFNAGHDLLHYLAGDYPPNYSVPATIQVESKDDQARR